VKRLSTVVAVLALSVSILSPVHAADGVAVTSGTMVFSSHLGQIDLRGRSGFRLQARVDDVGGLFAPNLQCEVPECPPGTVVDLYATWSGQDLWGTASLRGSGYLLGSEGEGGAAGLIVFFGSVVLPDFTPSGTAEVRAPFTVAGLLSPVSAAGSIPEPFSGGGTATLQLTMTADGTSWAISGVTYAVAKSGPATLPAR
jgi:hypothetical protein